MISLDWFVCFLWWAQFIKFKLECMTSVWSQNNISFLKFQTITILYNNEVDNDYLFNCGIFLSTIGSVVLTCFRILEYRCILFVRNKILPCHEEMRLNWQDWWSFFWKPRWWFYKNKAGITGWFSVMYKFLHYTDIWFSRSGFNSWNIWFVFFGWPRFILTGVWLKQWLQYIFHIFWDDEPQHWALIRMSDNAFKWA